MNVIKIIGGVIVLGVLDLMIRHSTYKECSSCRGKGGHMGFPDEWESCDQCNGNGYLPRTIGK